MKASNERKAGAKPTVNGAAESRRGAEAEMVGAQGLPLSAYAGWDAERGEFIQDDPRTRPSAMIRRLAEEREAARQRAAG